MQKIQVMNKNMNEDKSKDQIPPKSFVLDKLLGIISISAMAIVLLYFLIAPALHHTHTLKPSQGFLYTSHYFLSVVLVIYFIVFIIKIVASVYKNKLNVKFSTSLVFDLVIILVGVVFLAIPGI